ncbi:L,D-transpeptidase family protein [Alkalicaulis satelles]|uniref:L,D-transpeptidase family protein n=1 Tax=Alkalicaulis satelles TaxID=2609175 RepID=A0A5M6ZF99_9PROT|nr:L,D-transpeptidase family protein [Alkalicaulis satelles]KAA5803442.1 L,D-transpeptidase family protein [Alkalicaulis satelles]
MDRRVYVCAQTRPDEPGRHLSGPGFGPVRAAIGRSGVIAAEDKREGDGATPLGAWPVRRALWREDRLARPDTALVLDAIGADDGWSDDPSDPAYNRPVRLPWPASHEVMTRQDGLYDIVVVLGHNDDPPVPGLGSAIFLHCVSPDYAPTEGCVAVARDALIALLALLRPGDVIEIV